MRVARILAPRNYASEISHLRPSRLILHAVFQSSNMNSHALNVIEFPHALALISERATSPLGGERVRELRPVTDRAAIEGEHARVAAVRSLLSAEEPWHLHSVPDARAALVRLREERATTIVAAVLAGQIEALVANKSIEDAIEKTIDEDGQVRDDASPALRKIR